MTDMYLEINNKKYSLSSNFPHKVSELRKKSCLEIEFNLYILSIDDDSDIIFFKSLKYLPNFLYIGNNYYFWIFENTNLEKVNVVEDRYYRDNLSKLLTTQKYQNQRRFLVKIQFSYKQVWGTNNRKNFDRDLLLRNLLE